MCFCFFVFFNFLFFFWLVTPRNIPIYGQIKFYLSAAAWAETLLLLG